MSARAKQTDSLTTAEIKAIGAVLRRGEPVRVSLPGGGRLHIDRRLPFLCLYRRPPGGGDTGTERLPLGEASYLLADGEPAHHRWLAALVREVVRAQVEVFGAFLLLELWAAETAGPTFRIHAPEEGVPERLLEALEKELLKVSLEGHETRVALCYRKGWTPPRRQRLLSTREASELKAVLLGLEIDPLYRDAASGELFPFELKTLHRGLAHGLKHAFYVFSRRCTTHRPAHFHELGRRVLTPEVGCVDRQLAALSDRFDVLLHVTPVNAESAWGAFRRSGCEREPAFLYRPRSVDPALLKRQLYRIPMEEIEDPTLAHLFEAKRDEVDRQLTMIEDRGTERFLRGSQQVFGELGEELLALAFRLLEQLPPHVPDDRAVHYLDAAAFVRQAEEQLSRYRRQDPSFAARAEVRDDVFGLMVSRGQLLVGRTAQVPEARVAAALAHEVGTHALTYHNGRAQPLSQLYAGTARYEALQEGLAVFAEYLVGGLSRPRLRLLAGRVVAVACLTAGAGFVETFRELHGRHGFNQRVAFTIAMRVYRGGGFTKDAIYLKGLVELLALVGGGVEEEPLYLGKVALEYLPVVEELLRRQVLSPGPLRPLYLDCPEAAARLERARRGLSVMELAEASCS